jgi:type 1 glutamine amidotransferase
MEYQSGSPLPGHALAGAHGTCAKTISRRQVTVPKKVGGRWVAERGKLIAFFLEDVA